METHNMKLKTKYFNCMKNGTKKIELRLNDKKRQKIKIGDEIIFEEMAEKPKEIRTKVVDLYHEDSFEELINKFEISLFADKYTTKSQLLATLNEIYPEDKQKEYGVVGIRIELVK